MEKKYMILVNGLLLIVLASALYFALKPTSFGDQYKEKYSIIDKSMNLIESNMNEITVNKDWKELKEMKDADKSLVEGLNSLREDIKTCYDNVNKKDSILSFKNKTKFTKKDNDKYLKKDSCLDNFSKYEDYKFSNDDDLNTRLQEQISLIMYEVEYDKKNLFADMLTKETNTIRSVAGLSSWLKIEYNTYK